MLSQRPVHQVGFNVSVLIMYSGPTHLANVETHM